MNIPKFVIGLHQGMDTLEFGVSIARAKEILGEPSEIEVLDKLDDDELNTQLFYYNDLGLTVFFEGDGEPILSCFETDNADTTLFGLKIFALTEAQIIQLMNEHGFIDIDSEVEEWGEKRVSFDDALIDFYFENDKLTTVNWGIVIGDDEEDW